MRNTRNRCPVLRWLLPMLVLDIAQNASSLSVNITDCSLQQLTFTLLETPNGLSNYCFQAICNDREACVECTTDLGNEDDPTVGYTINVSVDPSCSPSELLSTIETEHCTLLIGTTFVLDASVTTTFTSVCTPTPSLLAISTSMQEIESMQKETVAPATLSTPVLVAIIAGSLLILSVVSVVAIASLLMWMRHSRIRARGVSIEQNDVLNMRLSFLFDSGDDVIDKDTITVYDSIVLDEEMSSFSKSDGFISRASDDGRTDCTTVETTLQSLSGYVGIQYKPQ